jgi:hypothetical protein
MLPSSYLVRGGGCRKFVRFDRGRVALTTEGDGHQLDMVDQRPIPAGDRRRPLKGVRCSASSDDWLSSRSASSVDASCSASTLDPSSSASLTDASSVVASNAHA